MNLKEFFEKYPDDQACLDKIMSVRFGYKPYFDYVAFNMRLFQTELRYNIKKAH